MKEHEIVKQKHFVLNIMTFVGKKEMFIARAKYRIRDCNFSRNNSPMPVQRVPERRVYLPTFQFLIGKTRKLTELYYMCILIIDRRK